MKCIRVTVIQNIRLKKLNLSSNDLSDDGVQFLAEALLANTTLIELNLSSTGITNHGIISLKEMLQFNETLEKLYLSENDIGNDNFCFKNGFHEMQDGKFMIASVMTPMVMEIGKKVNKRYN